MSLNLSAKAYLLICNNVLNFRPSLDKSVELLDNQITNLKRKMDFNSNTIYQQEK